MVDYKGTNGKQVRKDSHLEKMITGPGGHIPDGTGSPPHGRDSGPGAGAGDDLRKELADYLISEYPTHEQEINALIQKYNDEANDYNLVGKDRIDYIREKVEEVMGKKEDSGNEAPEDGGEYNNKDSAAEEGGEEPPGEDEGSEEGGEGE